MCLDETVWKRRLLEDFNFDGAGTARQTGWKFIYNALYRPRGMWFHRWTLEYTLFVPQNSLRLGVRKSRVSSQKETESSMFQRKSKWAPWAAEVSEGDAIWCSFPSTARYTRCKNYQTHSWWNVRTFACSHSFISSTITRSFHALDTGGNVYVWGMGQLSPMT